MSLSWRDTGLGSDTPDFVLTRERERPEPEVIGRVMQYTRSASADFREGWFWSLTSQARPVGVVHPGHATSGFVETEMEAREALLAAWRAEDAFRAKVRASPAFATLGPEAREFLVHGQPTPPRRRPIAGA